jgi:NAD(P)-dependent dehydrogenase (short-subunit alcohol dehydrogenase family)
MSASFSLEGKVAIVTGASRGIGEAIARALSDHGARTVLASRKQETLEEVARSINEGGGRALAIPCHTGKLEMIEALFARVMEEHGRVDVLVNNAATNPYFGPMLGISEAAFDKTFEVNTKGYFFMAQKAGAIMAEQESGSIVNVASIAGMVGPPFQGVYGMSKAAVILMTRAFARELGPAGVRCNAICPGLTETKSASMLIDTEAIYETVRSQIPMNRHAQPDEIAGAAVYLASDASSFTNGAVLTVDGGHTA